MSAEDDRTVIRPTTLPPTVAAGPVEFEKTRDYSRERGAAAPAPSGDGATGLPIGTRLGEFEIVDFIGEGGFGVVYVAYDHSLHRKVALKEYMPSSLAARVPGSATQVQVKSARHRETFEAGLKSFINEARLLASFDHPSLVKVYRFWEANGTAYMVMPLLEGVTMKDKLRELGQAPDEAWLLALLGPVTEALTAIHVEQCYHRDIAPDNIMLLANGRWLLLDFGAARRVIGDMTQALTVILKPGYAPVEQYAEVPGMKQGAWTDVYALAASVYYAITGRTPPPSVGRMLNDTYQPLAQVAAGRYSARFLEAMDRALVVKPEERTQTIAQLREQIGLGGVVAHADPYLTQPLPPGSVPPRPAAAPRPPTAARGDSPVPAAGRKTGLAVAAGVLALAALGGGAYFLLAPAPRPAAAPQALPAPALAPVAPAAESPPVAYTPEPAPPPASSGLDPVAEFDRIVAAQAPGFGVQAGSDKTTLKIGHDQIRFAVRSERDGYLYVFAHASDGTLLQFIPNTVSGAVKVKQGQRFVFPVGDGVVLDASDPPGAGELLVVVSARQRDFAALDPKKDGPFRYFPTGSDAAAVVARHAGPQPLLLGRAICPASGECDQDYGAAVLKFDFVK